MMLSEQKILSKEQTEKIAEAQREAERELNAPGTAPIFDIMPLEKLLIKHCGQEATLIHTGRSRQDILPHSTKHVYEEQFSTLLTD